MFFEDPCSIHAILDSQLHIMVCMDKKLTLKSIFSIVHSALPNQSWKESIIFHFKYFQDWTLLYSDLTCEMCVSAF